MSGRRLPGALHKIAIGSHGPRHPLDDAALQPILEAVDQALRPADQDVGVRAQLLVGPSQNVPEVGPRADGREHELRGGVADVLELDVGCGAIAAAPSPPYARRNRQGNYRADERGGGAHNQAQTARDDVRVAVLAPVKQVFSVARERRVLAPGDKAGEARCFRSMPQAVSQAKSIQR